MFWRSSRAPRRQTLKISCSAREASAVSPDLSARVMIFFLYSGFLLFKPSFGFLQPRSISFSHLESRLMDSATKRFVHVSIDNANVYTPAALTGTARHPIACAGRVLLEEPGHGRALPGNLGCLVASFARGQNYPYQGIVVVPHNTKSADNVIEVLTTYRRVSPRVSMRQCVGFRGEHMERIYGSFIL